MQKFRNLVYGYYHKNRRNLPWRATFDPYRIFISEVMLQQTQASRVIPKYAQFLRVFPDFHRLAVAPLRDILLLWQGLGYNRRAIFLKRAASIVVSEHGGKLPLSIEKIARLPGIGKASAAAIFVYSWNKPAVFIETNIRTVFIHHFFPRRRNVSDKELLPFVARALPRRNHRGWYSALMDYGTHLKKTIGNASRRSAHHLRQSRFEGSRRQVRGKIIRALSEKGSVSLEELSSGASLSRHAVEEFLAELAAEGFLRRSGRRISLSETV